MSRGWFAENEPGESLILGRFGRRSDVGFFLPPVAMPHRYHAIPHPVMAAHRPVVGLDLRPFGWGFYVPYRHLRFLPCGHIADIIPGIFR